MNKLVLCFWIIITFVWGFSGCGEEPNRIQTSDVTVQQNTLTENDAKTEEKTWWDSIILCDLLPDPKTDDYRIDSDYENELTFALNSFSRKEYVEYKSKCKEFGFSVNSGDIADEYVAFNSDGDKLVLSFSDSETYVVLTMAAEYGEFEWPYGEIGKIIPATKSNIGKVEWEDSDGFLIEVSNMPKGEYLAYVKECVESGFDVDYVKGDDYYYAYNDKGISLSLDYDGFNTVTIHAYKDSAE